MLLNKHQYVSLIGSLLYVAVNTIPDIAVSVSILGRSVSVPIQDWNKAKRILRYLKLTMDDKLVSERKEYVDADWTNDVKNRNSNSGHLFLSHILGSRKLNCVNLSTEAKFVALRRVVKSYDMIDRLLTYFSGEPIKPILIHGDNQSCIKQMESGRATNRGYKLPRTRYDSDAVLSNLLHIDYDLSELGRDITPDSIVKRMGMEGKQMAFRIFQSPKSHLNC